jgi:hypothetical protein
MSDTPRTDALIADLERDSGCKAEGNDLVVIEFLRQLERELALERRHADERKMECERLAKELAEERAVKRELLMEVSNSGLSYSGPRYVEVQLSHETWAELQRFRQSGRE